MAASEQELKFAFWTAAANWVLWRADFEFDGAPENLPVLAYEDRFAVFTHEYGLLRYKRMEKRDTLRLRLHGSDDFRSAVEEQDGSGVDKLAHQLAEEYPGFAIERSLVSKLASFARPASLAPGINSRDAGWPN